MKLSRAVGKFAMMASLVFSVALTARAEAPSAVPGAEAYPSVAAESAVIDPSSSDASAPIPFVTNPEPPPSVVNTPPPPPPQAPPGTGLQIQGLPGETVPWSIVVLLTGLTLIPSILLCVTPFARLLIVFHFLRQALGLQTTPSNQTLIGLSLILTFFLMQPVAEQIYQAAILPMQSGQITAMEALSRGEIPIAQIHVPLRARKRCGAVHRSGQGAASAVRPTISPCAFCCPPISCRN